MTEESTNTAIKIVGVMDEDPFDYRTWSGSSKYFFGSLQESGVLAGAVSAEASKFQRRISQLRSFNPDLKKWKFKYHLDTKLFRHMSEVAKSKISALHTEFNVILQVGAWYDLTRNDCLNVSYHDGNLAAKLSSPFGHPKIAQRYINRALEYEKQLYKKLDLIFPMSSWLADSFVNDFGASRDKVFPVGAGINLPYIKESEGRNYDSKTLLMVGKDFERKGGKDLIDAFKIVRKAHPDARLKLIGPQLESLPDGVECLGFIAKNTDAGLSRLLDEYLNASIFVLPSLYEPFGISFIEAMAHRLPCIGTNICAMPEILSNGETGFLVPPESPKELASKIIELLENPEQCAHFGNSGYQSYQLKFNWNAVTKHITDIAADHMARR